MTVVEIDLGGPGQNFWGGPSSKDSFNLSAFENCWLNFGRFGENAPLQWAKEPSI